MTVAGPQQEHTPTKDDPTYPRTFPLPHNARISSAGRELLAASAREETGGPGGAVPWPGGAWTNAVTDEYGALHVYSQKTHRPRGACVSLT